MIIDDIHDDANSFIMKSLDHLLHLANSNFTVVWIC